MRIFLPDSTTQKGKRLYELDPVAAVNIGQNLYTDWKVAIDSIFNSEEEAKSLSLFELRKVMGEFNTPLVFSSYYDGPVVDGASGNVFGLFSLAEIGVGAEVLSICFSAKTTDNIDLHVSLCHLEVSGIDGSAASVPVTGATFTVPANRKFHRFDTTPNVALLQAENDPLYTLNPRTYGWKITNNPSSSSSIWAGINLSVTVRPQFS